MRQTSSMPLGPLVKGNLWQLGCLLFLGAVGLVVAFGLGTRGDSMADTFGIYFALPVGLVLLGLLCTLPAAILVRDGGYWTREKGHGLLRLLQHMAGLTMLPGDIVYSIYWTAKLRGSFGRRRNL